MAALLRSLGQGNHDYAALCEQRSVIGEIAGEFRQTSAYRETLPMRRQAMLGLADKPPEEKVMAIFKCFLELAAKRRSNEVAYICIPMLDDALNGREG